MYDSITPTAIPTTAAMVAGYVDGLYAWSAAGWARFPHAVHVPIACFASTNAGVVLDVETGDATPAQAPGWVQRRRAAGVDPTVYCNLSLWPAVRRAFDTAQVPQPHYWIAHYGAGPVIPPGAVAVQYADPAAGSGGNWDLSAVADYWPGVDQEGGHVLDLTNPTDAIVVAGAQSCLPGVEGKHPAGDLYLAVYAVQKQVAAIDGSLSTHDAAILAAVQTVDADTKGGVAQLLGALTPGGVDPKVFAAALAPVLAPMLPAAATPAAVGEAVVAALKAHLAAPPTT